MSVVTVSVMNEDKCSTFNVRRSVAAETVGMLRAIAQPRMEVEQPLGKGYTYS